MGIRKVARPAVFVDRDGVINATVLNPSTGRMESPLRAADFRFIDGAIPALRQLQCAGFPLILVSNQPNFALGKASYAVHDEIHHKLVNALAEGGVHFVRFGYCLHHPSGLTPGYTRACQCRKPSPGLLLQARDDFSLTLADSWMIGDQPTDTLCGRAGGVHTIRITSDESDAGAAAPVADRCADYFAMNLREAAGIILGTRPSPSSGSLRSNHGAGVDFVPSNPGIAMKHLDCLARIFRQISAH
jgi:D-glycero-D-manno-heptose 1,7-bisphosphate phosphatase